MKLSKNKTQDSLYVRVIQFALKFPDGFKYSDIINSKELNLQSWESNIIGRHFEDALNRYKSNDKTRGETIFLFIHGETGSYQSQENKFILTLEAEFAFTDYQELKFARENAKQARNLSLLAISISMFAIIVSVLVPYLIARNMIQNVKIDSGQLQYMKDLINSKSLNK